MSKKLYRHFFLTRIGSISYDLRFQRTFKNSILGTREADQRELFLCILRQELFFNTRQTKWIKRQFDHYVLCAIQKWSIIIIKEVIIQLPENCISSFHGSINLLIVRKA